MTFSKDDFTPDNAQRLSVIIMKQMGKPLLSSFRSLGTSHQAKFNRLMNEYIRSLPEDWEPKLMGDFNALVNEDLLTDEFDPSTLFVPILNSTPELLLTEEQKAFQEEENRLKEEEFRDLETA